MLYIICYWCLNSQGFLETSTFLGGGIVHVWGGITIIKKNFHKNFGGGKLIFFGGRQPPKKGLQETLIVSEYLMPTFQKNY
jgi:hypothetical protein